MKKGVVKDELPTRRLVVAMEIGSISMMAKFTATGTLGAAQLGG